MNRDIVELREVIQKLVPLLAGKGLTVTQRGSQAYVLTNPNTRQPESVNIPSIPDNAKPDFIRAIQGFIDHEVAHVLYTDWNFYGRAPSAADLRKVTVQQFLNTHNIVEDTMIERRIVSDFPGSERNVSDLRKYFLREVTDKALKGVKDEKKRFIYLLVPTMRALAGHVEMQDWMDAGGHWSNKFVDGVVKGLKPETLELLKSCTTTKETLAIAEELHLVLYPVKKAEEETPSPPAKPKPKPEPKKEEPKEDEESEGEDKPDEKAGPGDGDKERDHEEAGEDGSSDAEAEDDAELDGADEPEEDEDADEPEEDVDGDDDASEADLDETEPGPEPDEEEAASGAADDDDAGDTEDGAADDDDLGGAADPEDEASDGDDASGEDEDPAGAAAGDDETDAGEEDEDDASGGMSAAGGEPGDEESETDDAEGEGATGTKIRTEGAEGGGMGEIDDNESEGEGGGGVGNGGSKSIFDFDEDAFKEADMSAQISILISEEAVAAMDGSQYNVFTRELDRIEPVKVPEKMNGTWVPKMEEEVATLTGRMQKDIERIMASQSHVIRTPGHRSGKLHAASLYRVPGGDARVFSQKQEHTSKNTAVTLLCDNSGSMSGDKMKLAMISAYALSVTLERVRIPYEVLGFTTGGYYDLPHSIREAMAEDVRKSSIRYDRIESLMIPIYKDFDEKLSALVKARFAYMMFAQHGLSGNVDGESLEYAAMRLAKRPEKRKVMLVLSDGQPAGGMKSGPHLSYMVKRLEEQGIECMGIGIKDRSVAKYYPKHVVLNDVAQLPVEVMAEIKRILA